jgi:hypothetical protein
VHVAAQHDEYSDRPYWEESDEKNSHDHGAHLLFGDLDIRKIATGTARALALALALTILHIPFVAHSRGGAGARAARARKEVVELRERRAHLFSVRWNNFVTVSRGQPGGREGLRAVHRGDDSGRLLLVVEKVNRVKDHYAFKLIEDECDGSERERESENENEHKNENDAGGDKGKEKEGGDVEETAKEENLTGEERKRCHNNSETARREEGG